MIFLRIISFIAGSFVLFASPFFFLSERQGLAEGNVITVIAAGLAVLLFGCAYFYFSLAGRRTARSLRARYFAAGLIGFQMAAGAWLLSSSNNAEVLIAAAPLLCFSVFLFLAFVYPGETTRNHRPMRRRERIDECLPH